MTKLNRSFETNTMGKWILVGEHTVLRGGRALVFPLPSAKLHFSFVPGAANLQLHLTGTTGSDFELLFWSVLEKACSLTNTRRETIAGEITLGSEIPVGAGLGASAAFCVAVARWFAHQEKIAPDQVENFARELENLFHGESSGVDIAVAHTGQPLKFSRQGEREVLKMNWSPQLFLSYTGQRGVTKECVAKVKELMLENPVLGADIDQMMMDAVAMAELALQQNREEGLPQLIKAIRLSAECFSAWGLFEGAPERQAEALVKKGALAVKPTGSGGGGFLLSLWGAAPKDLKNLMPCC